MLIAGLHMSWSCTCTRRSEDSVLHWRCFGSLLGSESLYSAVISICWKYSSCFESQYFLFIWYSWSRAWKQSCCSWFQIVCFIWYSEPFREAAEILYPHLGVWGTSVNTQAEAAESRVTALFKTDGEVFRLYREIFISWVINKRGTMFYPQKTQ